MKRNPFLLFLLLSGWNACLSCPWYVQNIYGYVYLLMKFLKSRHRTYILQTTYSNYINFLDLLLTWSSRKRSVGVSREWAQRSIYLICIKQCFFPKVWGLKDEYRNSPYTPGPLRDLFLQYGRQWCDRECDMGRVWRRERGGLRQLRVTGVLAAWGSPGQAIASCTNPQPSTCDTCGHGPGEGI